MSFHYEPVNIGNVKYVKDCSPLELYYKGHMTAPTLLT